MLDRQKLESILLKRFPGASRQQIAASANAIMGLEEEWEEIPCPNAAELAGQLSEGVELRLLRRMSA